MPTAKARPKAALPPLERAVAQIADLKAAPYNPRRIDKKARRGLEASLRRFGMVQEVVVNRRTGYIVGGHQRVDALRETGVTEVPVVYVDLDDKDERALNVTLNSDLVSGTFDDEKLAALIADIGPMPEFEGLRLDELLASVAPAVEPESHDDDEVPELAKGPPQSVPGRVYELGPHRLICGDCRVPETLTALLGDTKVNVALTSPPYASQRTYDESSGFRPIHPDAFVDWFEAVQAGVRAHLAGDGSWFVNIKEHCDDGQRSLYVKDLAIAHVRRWGWMLIDELVWVHGGTPGEAHRRFKNGFEPIFQFAMGSAFKFRPEDVRHESDAVPGAYAEANRPRIGAAASQGKTSDIFANPKHGHGLAYPSNALRLGKNRESLGHGAAYPVDLPAFFIQAYSDEGDVIFDPFMGSGTTLIAAARHQRVGYGCEISPTYCDVIRRRWTRRAKENGQDVGSGGLE